MTPPGASATLRGFPRSDVWKWGSKEEAGMVSTVTTTTVTTVTLFGISALLGLAAVLMLISYLVTKEMLSASSNRRLQLIGRRLNIAVVPLLLVFATIVGSRVADVLA